MESAIKEIILVAEQLNKYRMQNPTKPESHTEPKIH
jgi:hypothetical protein